MASKAGWEKKVNDCEAKVCQGRLRSLLGNSSKILLGRIKCLGMVYFEVLLIFPFSIIIELDKYFKVHLKGWKGFLKH